MIGGPVDGQMSERSTHYKYYRTEDLFCTMVATYELTYVNGIAFYKYTEMETERPGRQPTIEKCEQSFDFFMARYKEIML